MTTDKPQPTFRKATPQERERHDRYREQIEQELPEIVERADRRAAAIQEDSFSGQLRRAVRASGLGYMAIVGQSGIPLNTLDEFMTGERSLSIEEVDRLIRVLNLELRHCEAAGNETKPT